MPKPSAAPASYTGYEIRDNGRLEYSYRSIRMALGTPELTGTPTWYERQAQDQSAHGDHARAATLYLAAALVSAGMSRTEAYEELAKRQARGAAMVDNDAQDQLEADWWSRRTAAGGET